MKKSFILAVFYLIFMLFFVGFIGSIDFKDEVKRAAYYKQGVKKGLWPDYKNLLEIEKKP